MKKLSVSDIKHSYDKDNTILNGVSFDALAGELLCVVGASGCGKSTLLRLISGLEKVQSGSIKMGDDVIASDEINVPVQKRNIGLVFQNPSLFPHLNVADNIAFGLKNYSKSERDGIIDNLLYVIGLKDYASRYPQTLSGGQQQRVSLARSLAKNPSVMLLDEPFANLDQSLRRDLAVEVIDILKLKNIPIIMVTHDPEEVLALADKMVLLDGGGKIRQSGTPESVYDNPVDVESASFFGAVNIIKGKVEGNVICTNIGDFSKNDYCSSIEDGSGVTLVVRPEGVKFAPKKKEGVTAKVEKIFRTAKGYNITLSVNDKKLTQFVNSNEEVPNISDEVVIAFDIGCAFVF